jgi:hypothetical protein
VLDELVRGVLEAAFGRFDPGERGRLLFRLFFGLLGAGLGLAGAWIFLFVQRDIPNAALRGSLVAAFLFLAAFALFNVALGRRWRWPGLGFVIAFVAVFATRILLGP